MSRIEPDLAELDLDDLRKRWLTAHGNPPPPRAGRELLELGVGWYLQSKAHGGIERATRQQLAEMVGDVRAGRERGITKSRSDLTPGTTLVREWNDRTYQVQVLETGYLFENRVWRSLSEIAREITGARWNGPKFFGLRQKQKEAA